MVRGSKPPDIPSLKTLANEVGQNELDRLRAIPRTDLSSRLSLVRALIDQGLDSEATAEAVWLWEHSLEVSESWIGVRSSYLIEAVRPLVERSGEARAAFGRVRGGYGEPPSGPAVDDWLTLSDLLGEGASVLTWLAALQPGEVSDRVLVGNDRLFEWAAQAGRPGVLGRLLVDPVGVLQSRHRAFAGALKFTAGRMPEEAAEAALESLKDNFRRLEAVLASALTAAGRNADAEQVEAEAIRLESSVGQ